MASSPSAGEPPVARAAPRADREARLIWPRDDHAQSLPAAPALLFVRLAKRWSIGAEQLLTPLGLREDLLEAPLARISIDMQRALIERARKLTREPGLGFYMGLEMRATNFGYLGFAAMSAATLREALELTIRFLPALTGALDLRLNVAGGLASLVVETHANFGSIEDVFILGAVVGLWQIGSACAGTELRGLTELTFPEPHYYRRFAHLLPQARFGERVTRLVFDASILELPIASADRAALRLAREQCDAALDALDDDRGLTQHVRRLIAGSSDPPASIGEVAAALRVSARTLRRRLAAQGVSFSQVLASARHDTALQLLKKSSLSVDAIAERLGYSTAPNFIRAFRRWTGETPMAYRRMSR